MTGRWTGRGLCMTGRVRSVFSVCAVFSLMIGRAARPVTDDRTRPVIQGAYWTLIGRWHCGVRSVQQRVRSVLLSEPERATGASGPSRSRSVRSGVQRGRAKRSDDRTRGASGHVRSDASGLNGSILECDRTRALSRPVNRFSASGHGNG
jgi:hypothetical protein